MRGSRFQGARWLRGRKAQTTRGAGLQGARWLPDADRKRRRRKQEAFPSRPARTTRFGPGLAAVCHAARRRDRIGDGSRVDLVSSLRPWLQFILDARGSASSSGPEKNGVQGPGRRDAPHGPWAPHVVQLPLGLRDPQGSLSPCIPDRASSGKL